MGQVNLNPLLPLAAAIARDFANIPGLPFAEIEMAAQEALAKAARSFDPAKGEFQPYAVAAMKNGLKDLYDRQVRYHQHHVYSLDEAGASSGDSTTASPGVDRTPDPNARLAADEAAERESRARLDAAISALPARLRTVAEGIRDGKTYAEIGASLGVSKQAAHKMAGVAIATLRENLAIMGFHGLDSVGLLKSGGRRDG